MEKKRIADPIHGSIIIEDELIWKLIKTKELLRLHNIMQLGLSYFIYPGATHTRYSHSLGTYELSRRLIDKIKEQIPKEDILPIKVAALLHDIGHGPMSHLFEEITNDSIPHEEYTLMLINDENSEIYSLLKSEGILEKVLQIIEKKYKNKYACQIISSQIDVDRLDYLLRDSYYSGTSYGIVDKNYLFENISIKNNELVFNKKTIPTIENFILGRHHMYVSVYKNKKSFCATKMYKNFFRKLFLLINKDECNINLPKSIIKLSKNIKLNYFDIMELDDHLIWNLFKTISSESLNDVSKIARDLLNGNFPIEDDEFIETVFKFDDYENQANIQIDNKIMKISEVSNVFKNNVNKD